MRLLPTDYAKNETILNFDLEDINIATICKTLDGDCLHLMKHPIIEGKNKSIMYRTESNHQKLLCPQILIGAVSKPLESHRNKIIVLK